MKFIILLAVVAFVSAVPASDEFRRDNLLEERKAPIEILQSDSSLNEDGGYNYSFEGADGTAREETAEIVNKDTDEQAIRITGSYKYINADGEEVLVTYTADENGFVPVSSIIPKEISETAQAARNLPNVYDEDKESRLSLKAARQ